MASRSLQSSHLELYEPSLTKPNPLRIVKRATAQPNGSPTRRIPLIRGSSANFPDSPPDPPDKPLTIRKLRKKQASISLSEMADEVHTGSVILAMVQQKASPSRETVEDKNKTLKPKRKEAKVVNIGNYVKDDLFKHSSDSEANQSTDSNELSNTIRKVSLALVRSSSNQGLKMSESSFSLYSEASTEGSLTPKRQLSRRRRFLQKAIGGFDGARSKSMQMLRSESFSKDSKDSLKRIVSRKNHKAATSSCSIKSPSLTSDSSFDLDFSARKAMRRRDSIPDFCNSPGCATSATGVMSTPENLLVPKITVLQGSHCIADGDENTVWVAIEVTGIYVKVTARDQLTGEGCDNHADNFQSLGHDSNTAAAEHFSIPRVQLRPTANIREQDYLYEMEVNIKPSDGCTIESVIGDIEEPRTIKNEQSELLIAKIRFADKFDKTASSPGHVRQSSETLIEELESRLIQCASDFIDITVTYKHSTFQFLEYLTIEASSAIAHQSTKLVTEARAVIKRHDSLAAWSPHALGHDSPLSELIRSHFPVHRAEDIIRRISSHQQPFNKNLSAILQRTDSWSSSEGTITPLQSSIKFKHPSPLSFAHSMDELVKTKSLHLTSPSSNSPSGYFTPPTTSGRESDPARKIWSEMRKKSKGTKPAFSIKTLTDGFSADDGYMDIERQRIREQALRNQRSLGADTLRSIVREKQNEGKENEDGVQGGRAGGWWGGPPWW